MEKEYCTQYSKEKNKKEISGEAAAATMIQSRFRSFAATKQLEDKKSK